MNNFGDSTDYHSSGKVQRTSELVLSMKGLCKPHALYFTFNDGAKVASLTMAACPRAARPTRILVVRGAVPLPVARTLICTGRS